MVGQEVRFGFEHLFLRCIGVAVVCRIYERRMDISVRLSLFVCVRVCVCVCVLRVVCFGLAGRGGARLHTEALTAGGSGGERSPSLVRTGSVTSPQWRSQARPVNSLLPTRKEDSQ